MRGSRESLGENKAHSLFLSGKSFKCPAAQRLFFFSKIETTFNFHYFNKFFKLIAKKLSQTYKSSLLEPVLIEAYQQVCFWKIEWRQINKNSLFWLVFLIQVAFKQLIEMGIRLIAASIFIGIQNLY